MSRIELRYLLPEDYRWMFDKLGGGFFSVVRLRYKPLVVKGCQRHSFAIAGIQCCSTVISLYNKMWSQAKLLGPIFACHILSCGYMVKAVQRAIYYSMDRYMYAPRKQFKSKGRVCTCEGKEIFGGTTMSSLQTYFEGIEKMLVNQFGKIKKSFDSCANL